MAKVAMETVDAVRRRLEVELPADEVIAEMDRAYDQLRRKANVRGFRQGRAPRSVLERMYGDQICADVFGDLIRRSFVDAIKEQEIEPVGEPEILTESAEPGAPLRYSANVEVKPNVVVEAYSGLEVERHLKAVTEADVAQFLESLRESCARLLPLTERTRVAAGDIATVDYDARIADRSVGHGHDRMMEAGGDDSCSLAQCLVGLERCVDATAAIDYPADYSSQELAGQHVSFRIRVKAIATKELPELNDEFAKEQSGSDTVEELRDRVRKQLEASAEQEADAGVRSALIDRLVQGNEFEVPGAMVERRTVALADEVLESL
ncbi:MAG: trigger factor, partial [Myxococcales bacterium]